jgi:hypothetical protein
VGACRARHAFASIGFPGTVGCLSGINDAGLTVAVMEAYQVRLGNRRLNPWGLPFALCFRRLLEEASSIEEAYLALSGMKRIGLNSLVVADRAGVAVFEITPGRVVVRRPRDGVCIGTNHFCTEELRPRLTLNMFNTLDHFTALEQVTRERGGFGVTDLHGALHAVCDPDITLQTMVFEPRKLRLHLAIGTVPASAGAMKVVDLEPFLRGASGGETEPAQLCPHDPRGRGARQSPQQEKEAAEGDLAPAYPMAGRECRQTAR